MKQHDRAALILVDVLNGFFHPDGAMYYPAAPEVLPAISELLEQARKRGSLVVHVADRHRSGVTDAEFEVIPEHLPRDGFDAEFFAGFGPLPSEPVVEKRRYSAFFATDLAWPWFALVGGALTFVAGWGASLVFGRKRTEPSR